MQLITTGINEEHQNSNQMKKICGLVRFTMYICVKYLKIYIYIDGKCMATTAQSMVKFMELYIRKFIYFM